MAWRSGWLLGYALVAGHTTDRTTTEHIILLPSGKRTAYLLRGQLSHARLARRLGSAGYGKAEGTYNRNRSGTT